jgi:hypothetical protein
VLPSPQANPTIHGETRRISLIRGGTRRVALAGLVEADLVLGAEPASFWKHGEFRQILARLMNRCPSPGRTPIHQKNISRQTEHPRSNRIRWVVCGSRSVHLKKRFLKQIIGDSGAA